MSYFSLPPPSRIAVIYDPHRLNCKSTTFLNTKRISSKKTIKINTIMKRTDIQQPEAGQAAAGQNRQAGLCARIATAFRQAFQKVFPPIFYIVPDMTLSLSSLEQQLDSIRQLKRTGARLQVICLRHGTEPFLQSPCKDCPKRHESPAEHIRRQEVVRETLDELFGVSYGVLP